MNNRLHIRSILRLLATVFAGLTFLTTAAAQDPAATDAKPMPPTPGASTETPAKPAPAKLETATFGGGCFWCTEGVFEQLHAVKAVVSGYAGGKTEDPTYRQICRGDTGHAEVIEISFDPTKISYNTLLDVFWKSHDPTTLNRQGHDVGTQYRSVIFYHNDAQKKAAEASKEALNKSKKYKRPIVTEISPAPTFYKAEAKHQDFHSKHPDNRYLTNVLAPKIRKLKGDIKSINEGATASPKITPPVFGTPKAIPFPPLNPSK